MESVHTEIKHLKEHIDSVLGSSVQDSQVNRGELSLLVHRDDLLNVLKFLREDTSCDFRMLIDITATDYPGKDARFEVIYNFLSLLLNQRIRIRVQTDEKHSIPSISEYYSSAKWYEREVWDMFGIVFNGHDDLRRILTDYEFEGHPLRKDFPLTGYVEMRYDEEEGRCIYEPVELLQDYRNFDFMSPWDGMTDIQLPGDEKATKPPFIEDDVPEQEEAEEQVK